MTINININGVPKLKISIKFVLGRPFSGRSGDSREKIQEKRLAGLVGGVMSEEEKFSRKHSVDGSDIRLTSREKTNPI